MSEARRALVSGVTGQDGSLLARLLLAKGYEVHGLMRRASTFNTARIDDLYGDPHSPTRLRLHFWDATDHASICDVLRDVVPDEVYSLAAQSHVAVSFRLPMYTAEVVGVGAISMFEAVRAHCPRARVYQSSSSEMFGSAPPPQHEETPFHPRSPYAVAKVMGFHAARHYRERGLWVANGILFNHGAPGVRGETFVERKVSRAVGRITCGLQEKVYLGNLDARRDWGDAREYVEGMWRILQADVPDDYVLATGESHSVRELVEAAFEVAGLDWRQHVEVDQSYFRPTEVDHLCGDSGKARRLLGWEPKTRFRDLVSEMVSHDIALARAEKSAREHAPFGRVV